MNINVPMRSQSAENWAKREGDQIAAFIFDYVNAGEYFQAKDLVGKIGVIRHLGKRLQRDIIATVSAQLVKEHTDDNPLLITWCKYYQVPTD